MYPVYSNKVIKDVVCTMLLVIRIRTSYRCMDPGNYLALLCQVRYNNLKAIVAQSVLYSRMIDACSVY